MNGYQSGLIAALRGSSSPSRPAQSGQGINFFANQPAPQAPVSMMPISQPGSQPGFARRIFGRSTQPQYAFNPPKLTQTQYALNPPKLTQQKYVAPPPPPPAPVAEAQPAPWYDPNFISNSGW